MMKNKQKYLINGISFSQFDALESRYYIRDFEEFPAAGISFRRYGELLEAYQNPLGGWIFIIKLQDERIISEPAESWRHFIPF